jgi:hypothetical protein
MEYPDLKKLQSSFILYNELKLFLEDDSILKSGEEITKKLLIWNYVNQYSDFYLLGSENYFSDVLNSYKDILDWELLSKEVGKTILMDCVMDNINLPWKMELFLIKK